MEDERQIAIANLYASGTSIKDLAEKFDYTPGGLRRLLATDEMQTLVARRQAHQSMFDEHYMDYKRENSMRALQLMQTKFLEDDSDKRLQFEAVKESVRVMDTERRMSKESAGPSGIHMDAETAKHIADAFKEVANMRSKTATYDIDQDPHFVSHEDAVQDFSKQLTSSEAHEEDT